MLGPPDPGLILSSRQEVGRQLAGRLIDLRAARPLVLGLPPGGTPVASEMARALGGDLDVVVSLKVSTPENARRAMGAVCELGGRVMSERRIDQTEHLRDDFGPDFERTARETARMGERYREGRPPRDPRDRVVVVATDGVVEPLPVRAVLRGVSSRFPRRVILATGVIPRVAMVEVRKEVGEAVALREPQILFSVAEWYREFPPVSEPEVQAMLRQTVQEKPR